MRMLKKIQHDKVEEISYIELVIYGQPMCIIGSCARFSVLLIVERF
jgi:hypothetical protein